MGNLLTLIKSYKDNVDVKVEVYFKNGNCELVSNLSFDEEKLVSDQGVEYSFKMISHAEIMSI